MAIEQVDHFLAYQLSLKHVFDGKLPRLFDGLDHYFQALLFQHGIGFDDCDGKGQVELFGVEKGFFHKLYSGRWCLIDLN